MKKIKFVGLIALLMAGMVSLVGCSSTNMNDLDSSDGESFTIGISQLAEHPALDDARKGFEDGLDELGIKANIVHQNAQGEIPNTVTISQKFVKDEVDLIYAIATPAAQSAKQATSNIPIIFSAVTDPVLAELVDSMESPGGNITGTSDESPIDRQLELFKDLDDSIKKVGIIYNTGENNSPVQIEIAKEVGKNLNLEIIEVGVSAISDMPQAVDSIMGKVDAIYTITDNMVASAINIVSNKAIENNMITIGAEDAHISGGILMTDGLSYYELGKQSAEMAKKIFVDKKSPADIPCEKAKNTKKVFNEETLNALGLDKNNKAFENAVKVEN